jgi:hypothetical protein
MHNLLLFLVLPYLPLLDLIRGESTCKQWQKYSRSITRWGNPLLYKVKAKNLKIFGTGTCGTLVMNNQILFRFSMCNFHRPEISIAINAVSYKLPMRPTNTYHLEYNNIIIPNGDVIVQYRNKRYSLLPVRQSCINRDFQPYSLLKMLIELDNIKRNNDECRICS